MSGGWVFVPNFWKRKMNFTNLKVSILPILEASCSKSAAVDSYNMKKKKRWLLKKKTGAILIIVKFMQDLSRHRLLKL